MKKLLLGLLIFTSLATYAGEVIDGYCGELRSIQKNDKELTIDFELNNSDAINVVEGKYGEFKSNLKEKFRSLIGINSYETYINLLSVGDATIKGADLFKSRAYVCIVRIIRDDYSKDHYVFPSFESMVMAKKKLKKHFEL